MSEAAFEYTPDDGDFYCPGCGQRFDTPGTCQGTAEGPHEPIAVEKVAGDAKAKAKTKKDEAEAEAEAEAKA
jgi:hypothetical protein